MDNFNQYIQQYQRAAEEGDKEACYLIGRELLANSLDGKNCDGLNEAAVWLGKAALLGHPEGACSYGECLQYGWGCATNLKEALHWYINAYNKNCIKAARKAGSLYCDINHPEFNLEKGEEWFRKAIENGDLDAACEYASVFLIQENNFFNPEKGLVILTEAAEKGSSQACYDLGDYYENGYFGKPELDKAIFWYRKGADMNSGECAYQLALCYGNGIGIETDEKAMNEWLHKSAALGYLCAYDDLGYNYLYGVGMKPSEKKGVDWFIKAYENGNNQLTRLGEYYENHAKKPNYAKAYHYYELGVSASKPTYYTLALFNFIGIGTPQNYEKALEYYKAAAANGINKACEMLGYIYEEGLGTERDADKAQHFYDAVLDLNRGKGFMDVADRYTFGNGVKANADLSDKWNRLSLKYTYGVEKGMETSIVL